MILIKLTPLDSYLNFYPRVPNRSTIFLVFSPSMPLPSMVNTYLKISLAPTHVSAIIFCNLSNFIEKTSALFSEKLTPFCVGAFANFTLTLWIAMTYFKNFHPSHPSQKRSLSRWEVLIPAIKSSNASRRSFRLRKLPLFT